MKKILKLTLAVVCVMCSTSLYAQKIGRISSNEIVYTMPETLEAQKQVEAFEKELQGQYETIMVEANTKYQEFQKNYDTMSDAVKQLKEKEIMELQNRLTAFQQAAGADIQKKSAELMQPIIEKANKAVQDVAKAGGYSVILETGSMVYFDEATVKDITPDVKIKLGIDPNAKPAQMQAQPAQ